MNIQQWHYIIKHKNNDFEIINDTLTTDLSASEICQRFEKEGYEILVLEKIIQIPCFSFKISNWLSHKKEFNYV